MKVCQYDKCGVEFKPKTHNQVYHTQECCRLATNERIMERYYEKKEKRAGKVRKCRQCDTVLSRYNDEQKCAPCARGIKADSDLTDLLDNVVTWG